MKNPLMKNLSLREIYNNNKTKSENTIFRACDKLHR